MSLLVTMGLGAMPEGDGGGGGGTGVVYAISTGNERPVQIRRLREGDYGFWLTYEFKDDLGSPVPIADDASVTFTMLKDDAAEPAISADGEVRYGTGGIVGFLFTSGTPVPESGRYSAVFQVGNLSVPVGQSIPVIVEAALA